MSLGLQQGRKPLAIRRRQVDEIPCNIRESVPMGLGVENVRPTQSICMPHQSESTGQSRCCRGFVRTVQFGVRGHGTGVPREVPEGPSVTAEGR